MEKTHPELVQNLPGNPLPFAFDVKPVTGDATERLASSLYPFAPGVEKVCPPPPGVKLSYGTEDCGRKATRKILSVARVIESISGVAILLLLAAATLLIANTIRLSIFARRREIEVMKLVGASNWFVRGPFVLEGVICGLVGSLAAIILLIVGKELVLSDWWFSQSDVHALPFVLNALIVIALGLMLGAAGSALTMRRFLRV
jgi:cell division transport system permease protein